MLKSTGIGKILRKCISERAKLQNFTEFHGKLPISRKTVHFTVRVRVTAVKSRNRLGPSSTLYALSQTCYHTDMWEEGELCWVAHINIMPLLVVVVTQVNAITPLFNHAAKLSC